MNKKVLKYVIIFERKKKRISPNVGLEPTTPRLRVSCSTDWASRAHTQCTNEEQVISRYSIQFIDTPIDMIIVALFKVVICGDRTLKTSNWNQFAPFTVSKGRWRQKKQITTQSVSRSFIYFYFIDAILYLYLYINNWNVSFYVSTLCTLQNISSETVRLGAIL